MCFDWVTYLSTCTSQGDPNIEGKCEVKFVPTMRWNLLGLKYIFSLVVVLRQKQDT